MENVRTIGYVATTWCSKALESVLDEIALYAGWGESDPSVAMSGILFDETPTRYSPEHISYLLTVSHAVRDQRGLKDGFVGESSFLFGIGCVLQQGPKPENLDIWYPFQYHLHNFIIMRFPLHRIQSRAVVIGSCNHRG